MTEFSSESPIPLYWWNGKDLSWKRLLVNLAQFKVPRVLNFGDLLSPFIVEELSGRAVTHQIPGKGKKLLALGSILHRTTEGDKVWGSGFLNKTLRGGIPHFKKLEVSAVRGPNTAELFRSCGLEVPKVYGDPAVLLPAIVENDIQPKYKVGVVPHYTQFLSFKLRWKHDPAIKLIDVQRPFPVVIRELLSCSTIFSSSLHGVIVAQAYGIPSRLVMWQKPLHGDFFKFEDYYFSHNADLDYVLCKDMGQLQSAMRHDPVLLPKFDFSALLKAFPYLPTTPKHLPQKKWSNLDFDNY